MPEFSTSEPISLTIDVEAGDIKIEASARTDTTVEVLPRNPSKPADARAAESTRVDQRGSEIRIEGPRERSRVGRSPEVRVAVGLPEGSSVVVKTASGDVQAHGKLGDTEIETASGDIRLEHVANLHAKSASGDILCTTVEGAAETSATSGSIRLPLVNGTARVRTASGDLDVGEVGGDAFLNAASGDIRLATVRGSVEAKSASGDVRLDAVQRGRVEVNSASGDISIAIVKGTAAWLELNSMSGDVTSELDGTDDPGSASETVEVHAGSLSGDITIKRAH